MLQPYLPEIFTTGKQGYSAERNERDERDFCPRYIKHLKELSSVTFCPLNPIRSFRILSLTVPYCPLLYCTVLYCTVLSFTVLYFTVPYHIIYYCILYSVGNDVLMLSDTLFVLLYCTVLYRTMCTAYCIVSVMRCYCCVIEWGARQGTWRSSSASLLILYIKILSLLLVASYLPG